MRALAAAFAAVLLLSGCEDTTPPAEVTVTEHVTPCQEDDPCWPCSPDDDACEKRG